MLRPGLACVFSVVSCLGGLAAQEAPVPDAPEVLWHHPDAPYARRPPAFAHGMVYAGGHRLVALNPATGTVLHEVNVDGPWGEPEVYGDTVIANRREKGTYAYHFTLDRQVWAIEDGVSRRMSGTVCGGAAATYVMPSIGGLVAVDLATGEEQWRTAMESSVTANLTGDGERVFVLTDAGEVLAVSAGDGSVVWRHETGSKFYAADPTVHDGELFVADRGIGGGIRGGDHGKRVREVDGPRGGAIHGFDAATGQHLWGRIFSATGCSALHVHGDFVWAGFGKSVVRLDRRDTGAMDDAHAIRTGRNPFGSPTVLGEQIVFGNLDGHLYVHDIDSGALAWKFDAGNKEWRGEAKRAQVGSFSCAEGRLFVSTTRGLFAIGDREGAAPVPAGYALRANE